MDRTRPIRGSGPDGTQKARALRRRSTEAEDTLWQALRAQKLDGLKFRRQHPFGALIVDFCCPSHRLVVELDGPIHDDLERARYDAGRTEQLESYGYLVLRFRNEEFFSNPEGVLDLIRAEAAG